MLYWRKPGGVRRGGTQAPSVEVSMLEEKLAKVAELRDEIQKLRGYL